MENEYMKRGYLLPPGCKDLHDALKLNLKPVSGSVALHFLPQLTAKQKSLGQPQPLPSVKGQIFIRPGTTVRKLAALLGLKPFEIIGDLMQLGTFATPDFLLDFKTISKVARIHGFMAIKPA